MVAAADADYRIVKRTMEDTPYEKDAGLALLNKMIRSVSEGRPIIGMGAAIGGPLDWRRGVVSPLHQKTWRNVPLKEIMERDWRCAFAVDVDANVAALGEYTLAGQKPARLLYLTLSTGMGGGLIVDGKIYRGMDGEHPEVAHQSVHYQCSHPENIRCECESETNDCLEALVSGRGIMQIYKKTPPELSADERDEVAFNLGQGLRNLATVYLPDEIVLGGGIITKEGGRQLLDRACDVMKRGLKLVPTPEVRLSRLGYDTALMGALVAAKEGVN
jgi:glucokinase